MHHAFSTSRRALFGLAATVTLTLLSTLLAQPSSAGEPVAASAMVQQSGPAAGAAEEVGLVPELATATSNTYREGDGSMRLESFTEPVNYLDQDETWVPIDNELIPAPGAAYEVMNAGNSFEAKIPADPSTTPVSFTNDAAWVTMRMHGLDDAPSVDGEVATFQDIAGADEVTYEVTNTGLKEDIRLEHAPSSANGALKYTYSIDASAGITPVMGLEDSIEFRNTAGEAVVVMPAAYMFDSATPDATISHDVTYELTPAGAGWKLTVTPSMQWLQDAARVYPVTIDPTLGNVPASKDCWIRDTTPTATACGDTAAYVKVGRSSGPVNYRGLLDFDTASIPSTATVDTAEVPLYLDHTQSTSAVTGDYALFKAGGAFSGSSATWSSSGASGAWVGGDPGATAYGTLSLNGTTSGFKIFGRDEVSGAKLKELVQSWVTNPNSKTGLVLKQAGTPTLNVLSFYSSAPAASNDNKRPRMNVTYSVPAPAVVDATVAIDPCSTCSFDYVVTPTLTPTVSFQVPSASTSIQGFLEIKNKDTNTTIHSSTPQTLPANQVVAWVVPAALLLDGGSYEIRVNTVADGSTTLGTAVPLFVELPTAELVPNDAPLPACGGTVGTGSTARATNDIVVERWAAEIPSASESAVTAELQAQASEAGISPCQAARENLLELQASAAKGNVPLSAPPPAIDPDEELDPVPTPPIRSRSETGGGGGGEDSQIRLPLRDARQQGNFFYHASSTFGYNHGHIALYRFRGRIVEAANSRLGVRSIAVSQRKVPKETYIMAIYDNQLTKFHRKAAAQWAQSWIGEGYRGALRANRSLSAPFNCSQLVWAAYGHVGWDLDPEGGRYVYPRDIALYHDSDMSFAAYYDKIE